MTNPMNEERWIAIARQLEEHIVEMSNVIQREQLPSLLSMTVGNDGYLDVFCIEGTIHYEMIRFGTNGPLRITVTKTKKVEEVEDNE